MSRKPSSSLSFSYRELILAEGPGADSIITNARNAVDTSSAQPRRAQLATDRFIACYAECANQLLSVLIISLFPKHTPSNPPSAPG